MNNKFIVIILLYLMVLYVSCIYYDYQYVQLEEKLAAKQNEITSMQNELSATKENLQLEIEKVLALNTEIDIANNTIANLKDDKYNLVYLGDFKITYYCDERYSHICGGNGVTASGKHTEIGVTAAADWSVLPKGSLVYIENLGFREIQDIGGGVNGNHIDVLVKGHQEAINFGTSYKNVWLLISKT